MHLLGAQASSKLKAHRLASQHYEKYIELYREYAQAARELSWKFQKLENQESRVSIVKAYILEMDPDIWGLANTILTAEQIAECYARLVVGHETEGKDRR